MQYTLSQIVDTGDKLGMRDEASITIGDKFLETLRSTPARHRGRSKSES